MVAYRLHTDSLALCAIEVIRASRELLKVDIFTDIHFPRVNLHDAGTRLLIGVGKLNLAIQTTWGRDQIGTTTPS